MNDLLCHRRSQLDDEEKKLRQWWSQLHEQEKSVKSRDEHLRVGMAECASEREELRQLLEEVADGKPASVVRAKPPAHWQGNGEGTGDDNFAIAQFMWAWREGSDAVMSMLTQSCIHAVCAGRDGTFEVHRITRVKVWRVENIVLWKQYRAKAEQMATKQRLLGAPCQRLQPEVPDYSDDSFPTPLTWHRHYNRDLNEVMLWHGTCRNHVQSIVEEGFDERVCNLHGMFGAGLYFAQDACKSGQYAARDNKGSHWFLLSRVLLGKVCKTQTGMPNIRRAPGSCDSVVFEPDINSQVGHHRELVVYDRQQVYPEFVVEACLR